MTDTDYRTIREDDSTVAERYPDEGRVASEDDPRLDLAEAIITKRLGRPLKATERVVHINGDTLDNRRENLRIIDFVDPADPECVGTVPIDSGTMLVVDACHIPGDLLRTLLTPNKYGVTLAAMLSTPAGDGDAELMALAHGDLLIGDPSGFEPNRDERWTAASPETIEVLVNRTGD